MSRSRCCQKKLMTSETSISGRTISATSSACHSNTNAQCQFRFQFLLKMATTSLDKWLRRMPQKRKVQSSNPTCDGIFPGRVIPVTQKLALKWPPCQAPGVIGYALGLVSTYNCLCRSVPEIHKHVAGTLSNQPTNNQDGIIALGKALMNSTPPLSSLPNVALKTVQMFVWLNTDRSLPQRVEYQLLPFSTPLSFR